MPEHSQELWGKPFKSAALHRSDSFVGPLLFDSNEQMKSLPAPYKSNCTDGRLKMLPYKYSVEACQFECVVAYVLERCKCRDMRWAGRV